MELVKNQEKIKKIKERAKALVEEMTLEEKVKIITKNFIRVNNDYKIINKKLVIELKFVCRTVVSHVCCSNYVNINIFDL